MNFIGIVLPFVFWLALIGLIQGLIRRLGYAKSHAWALAFMASIPLLNLFLLLYFSMTEWPIEKSQREARMKRGEATPQDLKATLASANACEAGLDIPGAIRECQLVLALAPSNGPEATEARKMLEMLVREYPQHQPSDEKILAS